MTDVFISHSSQDTTLAKEFYELITGFGINSFLSSESIKPGEKWSQAIKHKLNSSKYVFILGTKNACESGAVNQEIGMAISQQKEVIPVLVDITPEDLPGWAANFQAIDWKKSQEKLIAKLQTIKKQISSKESNTFLLILVIIVAILLAFMFLN